MKKKFIIFLMLLFAFPLFVNAEITQVEYGDYDDAINMVQEVMKSYYIKGPYFQYNYAKASYGIDSPEEGTSQDNKYSVCAAFTYNVYTEALGMVGDNYYMIADIVDGKTVKTYDKFNDKLFPRYNYHIIMAADNYYTKIKNKEIADDGNLLLYYESNVDTETTKEKNRVRTREIVQYIHGANDNNTGVEKFEILVNNVQPGDLFVYSGHALIAYGVYTNPKTNKKDVLILNSTADNYIRSKIASTSKLSYDMFESTNGKNGIIDVLEEGTFQYLWLSGLSEFVDDKGNLRCINDYEECAVIRPFYKSDDGKAIFNYSIDKEKYNKSKLRTQYPGLFIEKTVSKGDNNSIYVGDELTYTIKITNKSKVTYDAVSYNAFNIEETLGKYVEYVSSTENGVYSNGRVTWKVAGLTADSSIELTYKVKVKKDTGNVGKTITSTGKFYLDGNSSISTGKVENKIIPKVTKLQKSYSNCYEENKNNYSGLELIDRLYLCATGKEFNFTNFDFNKMFKKTVSNKSTSKIIFVDNLDEENTIFKNMILNNYYSGLASDNTSNFLPRWNKDSSPDRAKTINSLDFKDGDVLIYENRKDTHPGNDILYTTENGIYAYVYINGKFVGKNGSGVAQRDTFEYVYYKDANEVDSSLCKKHDYEIGEVCNYSYNLYGGYKRLDDTNRESILTFANYQTLFGKDNYVILRPELVMEEYIGIKIQKPNKVNYIQNEEKLDLTGGSLVISYNNRKESKSLTDNDVSVSGFDNSKLGTNTLTVEYGGHTETFDVKIIAKDLNVTVNPPTGVRNLLIITIISFILVVLGYKRFKKSKVNN